MECKFIYVSDTSLADGELIDTLWNVNKILQKAVGTPETRINRYIMECKCVFNLFCCFFLLELIDTLWNVNR